MSELSSVTIKKLKVAELKAELSKRGLPTKGKKDELASRLLEATTSQVLEAENIESCEQIEDISQDDTEEQPETKDSCETEMVCNDSDDLNGQIGSEEQEPEPEVKENNKDADSLLVDGTEPVVEVDQETTLPGLEKGADCNSQVSHDITETPENSIQNVNRGNLLYLKPLPLGFGLCLDQYVS